MILSVQSLTKQYRKNRQVVQALKSISFAVPARTILGVLGPNGAGKTTLLKVITGISESDGGQVTCFGELKPVQVRNRIGFLPENPEFFRNITAWELLAFSLQVSGLAVTSQRIDEVLHHVGLHAERHGRIRYFSKGMVQRIGIAQAVIHDPELLILDEPMSGLDPLGRRMVGEMIGGFQQQGKTVIFSTHDLDDIEEFCSDVLVLVGGEVRHQESVDQLRRRSVHLIEVETGKGREIWTAENQAALWTLLAEVQRRNLHLVRVKSGLTRELGCYYESAR